MRLPLGAGERHERGGAVTRVFPFFILIYTYLIAIDTEKCKMVTVRSHADLREQSGLRTVASVADKSYGEEGKE